MITEDLACTDNPNYGLIPEVHFLKQLCKVRKFSSNYFIPQEVKAVHKHILGVAQGFNIQ